MNTTAAQICWSVLTAGNITILKNGLTIIPKPKSERDGRSTKATSGKVDGIGLGLHEDQEGEMDEADYRGKTSIHVCG